MIPLEDPTTLSLLYHLNSEPWLNDEAYRGASAVQEFKRHKDVVAEIPLSDPQLSELGELFRKRRSCRAFAQASLPRQTLSSLLAAAYGVVEIASMGEQSRLVRRSVPSAGGLFPLEVYLFLRQTEGLEDGLYHYDVLGHSLQLLKAGDFFASFDTTFYTFPFIKDANLVLAFAAVFSRTQKKYGPRGYRYILLEAGHVGQNVCLTAADLGLATLCMGGFIDSQLNATIGLDPKREGVVYTIAAGYDAEEEAQDG